MGVHTDASHHTPQVRLVGIPSQSCTSYSQTLVNITICRIRTLKPAVRCRLVIPAETLVIPGIPHWPASLAYLMCSRTVRDLASKKNVHGISETTPKVDL